MTMSIRKSYVFHNIMVDHFKISPSTSTKFSSLCSNKLIQLIEPLFKKY